MMDRGRSNNPRSGAPGPRPVAQPAQSNARDEKPPAQAPIAQEMLRRIITDKSAAQELVREAERLGQVLAKPLTTSQIRSLFSEVRQIQADWQHNAERAHRRLILLKPKMAYRAKKEAGEGVKTLVAVLSPAVDLVEGDAENFRRFVEFFEAILAYHKAHGGN